MSCDTGRRRGSDLALLWLWCRLVATALIGPLAWEPPYAAGVAIKSKKRKKKKNLKGGTRNELKWLSLKSRELGEVVAEPRWK